MPFKKGFASWNKGKTGIYSKETLKKMSESRLGKKLSKETIEKLKGRIPWNKGLTKETNKIIKGFSERMKTSNPTRLKVVRDKISKSRKGISNPKHSQVMKKLYRNGATIGFKKGNKLSVGKNAWNWKGGISTENEKERKSIEYSLWRESVFVRDDFTCQKYGVRGEKLHAHHILNFADYSGLRTSIENGITLSKKAHKEFHHIYGIKNNTRKQLDEFLSIDKLTDKLKK